MHGVPMGSRMSDDQLNFPLLLQEDLEEWMKILACASFDYMKLMVVELQHQLAELEEAEERAATAHAAEATEATEATADGAGGGGEPRPPPRQRANPFNNQVRLGASSYYLITFVVFSSPLPPCLLATSLSKL